MLQAMNLSVRRFLWNSKGDIPVSQDKAGIGVELVAPIMNRNGLFCKRSNFAG